MELLLDDRVVAHRGYDVDDTGREFLAMETPIQNGKKHGREYTWEKSGDLILIEPYFNGLNHGTAYQYFQGKLIGSYSFNMGTGWDLWWSACHGDGRTSSLSEARHLVDGERHGFEWWLNSDERSVSEESHFRAGKEHGITRRWSESTLDPDYPKYFLNGEEVNAEPYEAACQNDPTLPKYRSSDNSSTRREFPTLVIEAIQRHSGKRAPPAEILSPHA
ncbi:MAG: hypothetical protein JRH20_27965 [Deltaproteobacteria bacterium]|nr:hypothetical protein [Deltaproteobacteria bacterium]